MTDEIIPTIPFSGSWKIRARMTAGSSTHGDDHWTVDLFAGVDADHRALCGTLRMRTLEWLCFRAAMNIALDVEIDDRG